MLALADPAAAAGLTTIEARRRLQAFGPNMTPDAVVHPVRLILGKFVAPVPCPLEAAIVLQVFLSEYYEAGVVAVLLAFNAALGLSHEGRAQATIAALKSRLALVASAIFYVVRERRRIWSSRPSTIVVCSIADMLIIPTLAGRGTLMAPLPLGFILAIFASSCPFAFVVDDVKARIFRHLRMV